MQTLARHQARLGCRVKVLCVNHANVSGEDITHSRFFPTKTVVELDGQVAIERVGRWFGVSKFEFCPSLLNKIKKESSQSEIVHLHTPNPLMLAAWCLAGDPKIPLVVTHHSDVIKQKALQIFVSPIENSVYKSAKIIFSDSPNYAQGSPILKKMQSKVKTLPLGIDLKPFQFPAQDILDNVSVIKKEYSCPIWLMVGRLTYYKGYHVGIEALKNVDGKLLIVGTGPLENELRNKAERLGVANRITWLQSVQSSNLIALYHSATALWFPSVARSEGFGLVQVEAMACGCPVINTDIPHSGVSWVSQDGISGLTIPINNPDSLSKASQKLLSDAALRKRLSQGAKSRATSEFDSQKMVQTCLKMYECCLSS